MTFGRFSDPRPNGLVHRVVRQQVGDERAALLGIERFDEDRGRVQLPAGPPGVLVEQLGTPHAREQDRCVPREVGDVFDEIEERRLSPLQVVDREDQRPIDGEGLHQRPERPEHLIRRRLAARDADRLPDEFRHPARVPIRPRERCELAAGDLRRVRLLQIRDLDEGLGQGVERDALPIREAAAAHDRCAFAELLQERGHEPGLADAAHAEDREELTRLVAHRPVEGPSKEGELTLPPHHRRIEVSCEPGRPFRDLDQAVRGHGIGLPLQVQGIDRLRGDRVAHEPVGLFPQQDLAGRRCLLQAMPPRSRRPRWRWSGRPHRRRLLQCSPPPGRRA